MRWTPLLLYAFFLLAACASPVDKNEAKNVNVDHELVDMHVDFAQNFTLESIENGYILRLIDPNTLKTERTYTLTYDHSVEGENTIHLPCSRIANLSQTSVGMMSILGATTSTTSMTQKSLHALIKNKLLNSVTKPIFPLRKSLLPNPV